jgi:DNA-binding transcriptional LysR family regulator
MEELALASRGLERGSIVVAASNIMGTHRVPIWLGGFAEEHPSISIRLELKNMDGALAALEAGAVDCAIVGGTVASRYGESMRLERQELLIVVASHHPLAHTPDAYRELERHRYLAREDGSGTERLARKMLGRQYRRGPVQELGQGAVQAGLLSGLGFAVMPSVVVESHVATGRLTVIPRPGRPVWQEFRAVRRRGAQSPAHDAFWDYLRQVTRNSAQTE